MSATLDEQVQAMSYEDRRALATALLYTALAGATGRNNSPESRLLRRALATLKQIKAEQPQPHNPT